MRKFARFLVSAFLGLAVAAHAAESRPLKVVMVSGSWEYQSHESLTAYKKHLEANYEVECTLLKAPKPNDLPGLDALDDCDVALFFTRRLEIEGEQLERVKKYCTSGRPIVACRTASHGFQKWLAFDNLVLGGNYKGHFGNKPTAALTIDPHAKDHLILDGVVDMKSRYSLYRTAPLADDCTVLMTAATPESGGSQPAAWTRVVNGGRVFYASFGGPEDFENATFCRMMANALFWTAQRDVARKPLLPVRQDAKPTGALRLPLRSRVETEAGSDKWDVKIEEKEFPIAETAILICDMWDRHWCSGATQRCEALAKKMNPVLKAARAAGVQIIHCPSETLYFYADSPQRRRMMVAPDAPLPTPLDLPDRKLPIDDSDGGCDTGEKPWYSAWTRQSPHIEIDEYDGISQDGKEVYNFLRQQGIKNLIVMGVHTNMCVLGRSFGIRQMTRWGIQCVLVRDLTDAMYNPEMPPHVSHDEGTQLVVQHIEKYWCPSILSEELAAGLPESAP